MGKPSTEFIAGSMAQKKLVTFWSPPVYFTIMIRVIIVDKLDIVSICRETMLIVTVLKLEDTSPFLVIPSKGASVLATGSCTGFPMTVHQDSIGDWVVFDGGVEEEFLGNAPYAKKMVTVFF